MQNYDLRNLIAADCVLGVLQRYPAVADRQRRCGTRRKTPQSDFRPRFSGPAARSPVDLLHDIELRGEFPGLDSAATPFGLKAMESLQELNDKKDRASNSQIMFMCLHAAGLTLLPTSIIGY